jgi:ParB-like chromosome segregation protein Spo0J
MPAPPYPTEPVARIAIELINPVHAPDVPDRLTRLVKTMSEFGWQGRPLLVLEQPDGRFRAWTGSHRYQAARDAGLSEIPCMIIRLNAAQIVLEDYDGGEDGARTERLEEMARKGIVSDIAYRLMEFEEFSKMLEEIAEAAGPLAEIDEEP